MQARASRRLPTASRICPRALRDIAWKGQMRMCRRYRPPVAAGTAKVVVTTALAHEVVGFIRAITRAVTAVPVGNARSHG